MEELGFLYVLLLFICISYKLSRVSSLAIFSIYNLIKLLINNTLISTACNYDKFYHSLVYESSYYNYMLVYGYN